MLVQTVPPKRQRVGGDRIANEGARSRRRTAKRRAQRDAQARRDQHSAVVDAARVAAAAPAGEPVRPTREELDDYHYDPRSALQSLADASGFDVSHDAFGEPPTLTEITDEVLSQRMVEYDAAMGPGVSLWACACCGELRVGEVCSLVALDALVPLRLNDEERVRYECHLPNARRVFNVVEHDGYLSRRR